jgi:hypothetical protein
MFSLLYFLLCCVCMCGCLQLAEETGQHYELSLSLSVLQQRLLSKERRLALLQTELTRQIGSTEVALLLDSPLVK